MATTLEEAPLNNYPNEVYDSALSTLNNASNKSNKQKFKGPKEIPKKTFKIIVRKLPHQNFNVNDFEKAVAFSFANLGIDKDAFCIDHLIAGKLSRKRGPVPSTGFICIKDDDVLKTVLNNSPYSLIEGDNTLFDFVLAPYQKTFRVKEKADKLMGTFEQDPEYQRFMSKLDAPVPKRPSAEALIDAKNNLKSADLKNNDPKQSALLIYLREKAEKKLAEKKLLKSKSSAKNKKGILVTEIKGKKGSTRDGENSAKSSTSGKGKAGGSSDASQKSGKGPMSIKKKPEKNGDSSADRKADDTETTKSNKKDKRERGSQGDKGKPKAENDVMKDGPSGGTDLKMRDQIEVGGGGKGGGGGDDGKKSENRSSRREGRRGGRGGGREGRGGPPAVQNASNTDTNRPTFKILTKNESNG